MEQAIRLTIENFDIERIGSELYTVIEIDLIRMYGLWKLYTGKKEEALAVFDEGIIIARIYKEQEMTEFMESRKMDAINGNF